MHNSSIIDINRMEELKNLKKDPLIDCVRHDSLDGIFLLIETNQITNNEVMLLNKNEIEIGQTLRYQVGLEKMLSILSKTQRLSIESKVKNDSI
jgi:hypothetical protein